MVSSAVAVPDVGFDRLPVFPCPYRLVGDSWWKRSLSGT